MDKETDLARLFSNLEIPIKAKQKTTRTAAVSQFFITTDSVVATAIVATNIALGRILLYWGDGAIDSLKVRPGLPDSSAVAGTSPLPPGTYQFSHAYNVPDDRKAFKMVPLLVVAAAGDIATHAITITITPRFRVTNFATSVRLLGPCDSFTESTSEFDIIQTVEAQDVNQWRWEPSNNFFNETQRFRLEGSRVSRELTIEDGSVPVYLTFTETDPLSDDHLSPLSQSLSPYGESGFVETTASGDGCEVQVTYYREVKLIKHLPSSGPTFEATLQ